MQTHFKTKDGQYNLHFRLQPTALYDFPLSIWSMVLLESDMICICWPTESGIVP